jgi:hypothetical protein
MIKKQMYIQVRRMEDAFELVFRICPQVIGLAILGSDFARVCGLIIDFVGGCFSFGKNR